MKTINTQPESLQEFLQLMNGRSPLYEAIALRQSTEHGMFYFIPYSNNDKHTVDGAVYYPVDYDIDTTGYVQLKNTLQHPKLIDSHFINEEVPITNRFLYSHAFANLAKEGITTDPDYPKYTSFNDFIAAVNKNRNIEYGVAVGDYDERTLISEIQTDEKPNSVQIVLHPTTVFTLHNHPNQTPPSPRDLYSVCMNATDKGLRNFRGSLVYEDKDSTFYGIIITDREKAAMMRESLKNEIGENNDFIKKGKVYKLLKIYKDYYNELKENEQWIAKLAIVAKHYGGGVKIVKYNKKEKISEVYDTNEKYNPVKCE